MIYRDANSDDYVTRNWSRLWTKVEKGPRCWSWIGHTDGKGYGVISWRGRGFKRAHRLVYQLVVGPVQAELSVLHHCNNKACVRPDHLFLAANALTTHGQINTPAYRSWMAMRRRCNGRNTDKWPSYGGRGIVVCDRWNDFSAFVEDMCPRPEGTTLDRINNDGNYEPGNCRWATTAEQNRNQRSNINITIDGVTRVLNEWCAVYGIHPETARRRIKDSGWDPIKAITTPSRRATS